MRILSSMLTMVAAATITVSVGCTATAPESDKLAVESAESQTVVKGVPGGVKERISKVTAKVKDIDRKARRVTLEDDKGNRRTIEIPPEAINFEQVEKGDLVTITYAEELIVYLSEKGAKNVEDGGVAAMASVPAGNKPKMVVADSVHITATVTAVDLDAHTATLKFADGSSRLVQVRDDVELKKSHVGREVVFQRREAVALSVEKNN